MCFTNLDLYMNEKTERSTRAAEDRESTYVPLAIAVLSVQRTDQVKYVFVYIQKPRVSGLSDIRLATLRSPCLVALASLVDA